MEKVNYSDEFICPKCGRHTALVFHAGGGHQAHCLFCDLYYDVEIAKTTNADRIRSMDNEELAEWIFRNQMYLFKSICNAIGYTEYDEKKMEHWDDILDWLNEEVK